jgi:hypothetical protein
MNYTLIFLSQKKKRISITKSKSSTVRSDNRIDQIRFEFRFRGPGLFVRAHAFHLLYPFLVDYPMQSKFKVFAFCIISESINQLSLNPLIFCKSNRK